jgi:hypothetical protein
MINKILKKILLQLLNIVYPNKSQNEEFVHYFFFYLGEFTYSKYTFWEKFFIAPSFFILIYFLFSLSFFTICQVFNIAFEPEKIALAFNAVLGHKTLQFVSLIGYTIHCFLIFRRYTKEIKKMSENFNSELTQHPGLFIQKRAMFTAAKFKAVKPVVLACIGCVTAVGGTAGTIEYFTGVNPLSEAGNVHAGIQTSEDAIRHIFNYSEYTEGVRNGVPPFQQDRLKKELMKDLEKIIQEKK